MTYTFLRAALRLNRGLYRAENALGLGYLNLLASCMDLTAFCMTHFPEENFLTEELCLAWATKKNTSGQ